MSKLREFRKELQITQMQLADLIKLPRYKIQLAEDGIRCLNHTEAHRLKSVFAPTSVSLPNWLNDLLWEEGYE